MPSTMPSRPLPRPTICGATVRNSSSTRSPATRLPYRCGPPSDRTTRPPTRARTVAISAADSPSPDPATSIRAWEGRSRSARRRAPAVVVARTTGTDGSSSPRRPSRMSPLPVTITTVGCGETERRAPLPERRRGRRMQMLRGPLVAASAGDRARSHEHDVRDRAEQGHHEAIGLVVTADHASTGLLAGPERDDPVERRDEVHQDGGPVGPERDRERPAIRRSERVGHRLAPVLTDRRGGAPELLDGDRRGRWLGGPRRVGHPVEGTGSRLPADARDDRGHCR